MDLFTRIQYKEILLDNLAYCQNKKGWKSLRGVSYPTIRTWLDRIHQNPVEEGLVFRAEDYNYSCAIDYAVEKGLLVIVVIEWGVGN